MSRAYIHTAAVEMALVELRDACKLQPENKPVISSVCTAVANILVGCSGTHQSNLMATCAKLGFRPEFYASTIRVTWDPD